MITTIDVLKKCEPEVCYIDIMNCLKEFKAKSKKSPATLTITIDEEMSCDMQKAFIGNAPDNHYLLMIVKSEDYSKALKILKDGE
jgi:hypothetical protein